MSSRTRRPTLTIEESEFESLYPELMNQLTKLGKDNPGTDAAYSRLEEVLDYSIGQGTRLSGLTVVTSYRHLVVNPSEENLKEARVVGWCVELLRAFFLVCNDYTMQKSLDSKGRACWYRVDSTGVISFNDACHIKSAAFYLLKRYLGDKPYYRDLVELFTESVLQRMIGLRLESNPGRVDNDHVTVDRYRTVVSYQVAHHAFYLPVAAAMFMAGITDEACHMTAKNTLLQMGILYQTQQDYQLWFDCPNPARAKVKDMLSTRWNWVIVTADQLANVKQREKLENLYRQGDITAVEKLRDVFTEELGLQAELLNLEKKSYREISHLVSLCDRKLPRSLFLELAQLAYGSRNQLTR